MKGFLRLSILIAYSIALFREAVLPILPFYAVFREAVIRTTDIIIKNITGFC